MCGVTEQPAQNGMCVKSMLCTETSVHGVDHGPQNAALLTVNRFEVDTNAVSRAASPRVVPATPLWKTIGAKSLPQNDLVRPWCNSKKCGVRQIPGAHKTV
jgi:hypothetical protein